jgi:hypothetical protein
MDNVCLCRSPNAAAEQERNGEDARCGRQKSQNSPQGRKDRGGAVRRRQQQGAESRGGRRHQPGEDRCRPGVCAGDTQNAQNKQPEQGIGNSDAVHDAVEQAGGRFLAQGRVARTGVIDECMQADLIDHRRSRQSHRQSNGRQDGGAGQGPDGLKRSGEWCDRGAPARACSGFRAPDLHRKPLTLCLGDEFCVRAAGDLVDGVIHFRSPPASSCCVGLCGIWRQSRTTP